MKITVVTSLFAKWYVDVDSGHNNVSGMRSDRRVKKQGEQERSGDRKKLVCKIKQSLPEGYPVDTGMLATMFTM